MTEVTGVPGNHKYKCPNGCNYPHRKKAIRENDNHTYCFAYYDVSFCPKYGHLMPKALLKLQEFFEVYNIHPKLDDSLSLIYKSDLIDFCIAQF